MSIRFSVIIPAYNEGSYLPRLLRSIDRAAANYSVGQVETIVADNSSSDGTADIARAAGCRIATVTKRCIAAARNGGAAVAAGEVLCFIDADSELHPNTFRQIDAAMLDQNIGGGATGVYLERMSPGLLLVYCMMIPIIWLTRIDTGVVFCRREDFDEIGGYNEDLLLAEDVDFLFSLKALLRRRGQRLTRLKGVKALGSHANLTSTVIGIISSSCPRWSGYYADMDLASFGSRKRSRRSPTTGIGPADRSRPQELIGDNDIEGAIGDLMSHADSLHTQIARILDRECKRDLVKAEYLYWIEPAVDRTLDQPGDHRSA